MNKLRAYLETLPDKQLIKLMRLAGIPEREIEKSRSVPGPFEREIPYRRSGSQEEQATCLVSERSK